MGEQLTNHQALRERVRAAIEAARIVREVAADVVEESKAVLGRAWETRTALKDRPR